MSVESKNGGRFFYLILGFLMLMITLAADQIGLGVPGSGFGTKQRIVLGAGLISIVYGALFTRTRRQSSQVADRISTRRKLIFAMIPVSVFIVLGFLGVCTHWSYQVYSAAKGGKGWKGSVYAPHPQLGHASVPNSNGSQVFLLGPDIPVRFGTLGFRVPVGIEQVDLSRRPLLMTLGCSYTFGAACTAEDTYAEQLARSIDGTALNAGVSSYGLAGMVLVAETKIPKYKPDLVVVQYSPWLVQRSRSFYLPSYYGMLPGPYFAEVNGGSLKVQPPVFRTWIFDSGVTNFRGTPKGFLEFSRFAVTTGIPWKCRDYLTSEINKLSLAIGATPPPSRDDDKIVAYGYDRIHSICKNSGATMVIVTIGKNGLVQVPRALEEVGVSIVRADKSLINNLPEKTEEAFKKAYRHWRGDPPRIVDAHPNPLAHSIIAESIYESVETWSKTHEHRH